MTPTDLYKQHDASRWTRIEMVLGLYDGAVSALRQAAEAITGGDDLRATTQLLQAHRFVIGILSGIDPDAGQIALDLQRLCLFVVERLKERDVQPALEILTILRDGFEAIRPEAMALERAGEIPEFCDESSLRLEV
jgi:flagellin-specific chaperone FliS